jgi:hypothetical protein
MLTIVNFPETHFLKNALCAKYLTDDFSSPLCAAQTLFPPVSPADPASAHRGSPFDTARPID